MNLYTFSPITATVLIRVGKQVKYWFISYLCTFYMFYMFVVSMKLAAQNNINDSIKLNFYLWLCSKVAVCINV